MNVLAFDTCFSALSVAVHGGRQRPGTAIVAERMALDTGHAEALMPMIERTMRAAGVAFADLDRIVVTRGPGTFTGVRTGIAAARGLALATGARLVGVSSLWAIAAAARPHIPALDAPTLDTKGGALLTVIDARKGQVYAQAFAPDDSELTAPLLLSVDDLAALLPDRRLVLVGTAAGVAAAALERNGRVFILPLDAATLRVHHQVEAEAMVSASRRAPSAGPLQPLYLRPADAKPQAGKSLPWVRK